MEKEIVIKVENIGKNYKIGKKEKYLSLRDSIANAIKLPYEILAGKKSLKKSDFWALKNVSFEVKKGEVVGIIGRNGAGKSTLLKILSRITEPTTGKITLKGRVSSLLEVGTGFHSELTGRENIYLNGAILGMTKKEIDMKFNDIVEFSGIEKFLDTPVKKYSSGMYVRLAFAVAAHLEPEILIVDEVLSVGDAEFQKKCLGKMKDVASSGRTVLFVSHNMAAIENLCGRCILLRDGKIEDIGSTNKIINKYLKMLDKVAEVSIDKRKDRVGNGPLRIIKVYFINKNNLITNNLTAGEKTSIVLELSNKINKKSRLQIAIGIDNEKGQRICNFNNDITAEDLIIHTNSKRIICSISNLPFTEGRYFITTFIKINEEISDWVSNASTFNVISEKVFLKGKPQYKNQGNVLIKHNWTIK